MKKVILLFFVLFLFSCSVNAIPVSKDKLTPYRGSVVVYNSDSEVKGIFTVVAHLTYYNWGKFRRLSVEDAIPDLKEQAQLQGANAIIIDNCKSVYSGLASRGIDVTARAILIKE